MVWNVSMKDEKDAKKIWEEGDYNAEIIDVKLISAEKSKSGNPYFWWLLAIENTEEEIEVRTTLIKGKRWLLKQLLGSCNINSKDNDPDEKYVFEPKDVLHKIVTISIVNRKNKFTGRDGNEIEFEKSEVNRVKPYTGGTEAITPETVENGSVDDEETPF